MASKPNVVRYTGHAVYGDGNQIKRAQSFSSNTDFTEERLLELANSGVAEKVDDAVVTATLETNDYGAIDNFMIALGQGFYSGTINPNRVFTDSDFDNAIVDFTVQIASDDTTLERTTWLGGMYLTGFSLTYTVDGISTESFDYEGDHKRHFLNSYKDTEVYKADFSDSSTALVSGSNLEGQTALILTVDEDIKAQDRDGDTITLTDNGANTEITATRADGTSVTFVSGDRVRLVVDGGGSNLSTLASTPAGIGGLRRGMVRIFMWNPSTGNSEETLRLQSVTFDGDLSRDPKLQLGQKRAFFRSLERPIEITVTVEALESDLEEWAKLSGNESGFDADTLNEIDIDDFVKTNRLEVLVYKSETDHTFANELKRIVMTDLSISTEGDSITVGEDGTASLTLTGENFLISGSGVSPFL